MSDLNQQNTSYKKMVMEEYARCAADPVYFMRKFYRIQHPQKGSILFNLYPFQEAILRQFMSGDYYLINKSRQLGISTLVSAYALWLMLFYKDKNILVLATTEATAQNLITKVRHSYDALPSWLKVKDTEHNKTKLRLKNGSQIQAKAGTENAARSEAVSLLVLDEAAFIEKIEPLWVSAQQTLATGGQCIALSSPNGSGNWFYNTWIKAQNRENKFIPLRLPWTVHPERDQSWRDEQDLLLGKRHAAQECFSGNTFIYTKYGPKPIKYIQVGDEVLSHDGTFNKVIRTYNHIEKDNLYEIKNGINNIKKYTTGNHPFLNKKGDWVTVNDIYDFGDYNQLFPTNIIQYNNDDSRIDLLDYIKVNNPKYFPLKHDDNFIWINKKSNINRFIEFDYKLGFIIGCFLSEGSYWKNVVSFSYNKETESEEHSWPLLLQNYINDKFNIEIFSHYLSKRDKGANLYIKNQIFLKFIELCIEGGKYCQDKYISPFVWENSNKETIKGILDGIMVGDGMLKKEYNCSLGLTSERLVYDTLYMSNLLGLYNTTIKKTQNSVNNQYTQLTFSNTKIDSNEKIFSERIKDYNTVVNNRKTTKFIIEDGIPLTLLQLIPSKEEIEVFNIEVENTHTYVTEYGIVHNCDADFITSGESVIEVEILNWYKETYVKDPIERRGVDGTFWIWEYADYSKSYMIVADVARGDGSDYSTFHVIDIENSRQVAEFKHQISPKDFSQMLYLIGLEYNNALVVVESNSYGWEVLGRLIEKNYPNIYYSPKIDYTNNNLDEYLYKYSEGTDMTPGFTMSLKTRPLVVSKLISYISERAIEIQSQRTIDELKTFIWKNGKPQAQSGTNDDLITSLGIGLFLRETSLHYQKTSMELSRASLGNIQTVNYSAGVYSNNNFNQNPYAMPMGDGSFEDLSWLLS